MLQKGTLVEWNLIPYSIWLANIAMTGGHTSRRPLEDYVLELIADAPGRWWISKLCRWLNEYDESCASIVHCGQCRWYANPRKRARAKRYENQILLPGCEHPWALHDNCGDIITLSQLCAMLKKLDKHGAILRKRETIPDQRQARGWDWATRLYYNEND